jgi:hypothetical protein
MTKRTGNIWAENFWHKINGTLEYSNGDYIRDDGYDGDEYDYNDRIDMDIQRHRRFKKFHKNRFRSNRVTYK